VEAVFEHHTGLMDLDKLDLLLRKLGDGSLSHEDVFGDHGHGALIFSPEPYPFNDGEYDLVVTGPRRNLMRESSLRTYFAAPYGDMMLTGCFGLLAAVAEIFPELSHEIMEALFPEGEKASGLPPWEVFN
jgi:hypothetical protein